MATTMAQALAERIRYQVTSGEKVLQAAGNRSDLVFGDPKEVLNVRGNVSDVAHTNHLWLLDAIAAGVVDSTLPADLQRPRPKSVNEAVAFLDPRDTDTSEQALANLRKINNAIAAKVAELPDSALDKPVDVTFYGQKSLRDLCFIIIEHGALHIGQAWGILKGHGVGG
jgi:hypothetical protein